MPTNRTRTLSALAVGGLAVLALAGPAAAHVHVDAQDPTRGAESTLLTFRVPNEKDAATTTKVEVTLPTDHPLAFVRPGAVPGWTATTRKVTLDTPLETEFGPVEQVVGTVTWTADPGTVGIAQGTFQLFDLSAGPLPEDAESLVLPTAQTYSDGDVVVWDDPTPASGEEPEHPAPEVALAAPAVAPAPVADDGSGEGGLWLGAGGLALGVVGALTGGLALRRSSRPAAPADGRPRALQDAGA